MGKAKRYIQAAGLLLAAVCTSLAAVKTTTIYSFGGGPNASFPTSNGPLLSDARGGFYGTFVGGEPDFGPGGVFHLTPPAVASGVWTETVLYAFRGGADGGGPIGGLARDAKGNLYGA